MVSFQDIMTRGIIFYDTEYLEECKEFCRVRDIQYLPHIHSNDLCYYFDKDQDNFVKKKIHPQQKVYFDTHLYDPTLLDAFREYDVLFVEHHHVIRGVVHFSDYNRSAVYEEIYKKLLLLEKGLIHLIVELSGLRKGDLFQHRKKPLNDQDPQAELRPQDFHGKNMSLKTILEFILAFQLVKIRESDIHKIIALRNKIAHSDDLVDTSAKGTAKYSMSSFAQLIHGVNSVEVALRQVGNRIYFMQETISGDFSGTVTPIEDYLFK